MAEAIGTWSAEAISALVGTRDDIRAGLSPDAIGALMRKGYIRRYAKGEMILEREDDEPMFFLALSGTARLTALTEDGREFVSSFMEPGRIWGVHPCLDNTPETYDTRAETQCELLSLNAPALRDLMWENRELQEAMTEILCKRLRLALNVLEQFATWNPKQRLAWRILQIVKGTAGESTRSDGISIAISQDAIASMIGLSRQRTNKLLKEFEKEGVLKIEYGSILVTDAKAIEDVLENLPHF